MGQPVSCVKSSKDGVDRDWLSTEYKSPPTSGGDYGRIHTVVASTYDGIGCDHGVVDDRPVVLPPPTARKLTQPGSSPSPSSSPPLLARPTLSELETRLENRFNLSAKAALFWVHTQLGLNSLALIAVLYKLLLNLLERYGRAGAHNFARLTTSLAVAAYWCFQAKVNTAKDTGSMRSDWVRHWPVFRSMARYYGEEGHIQVVENGWENKVVVGKSKSRQFLFLEILCSCPHVLYNTLLPNDPGRRDHVVQSSSLSRRLYQGAEQ